MTPAELSLLKSLAAADVVTFIPEDNTPAARAKYEATIESLQEMEKVGWVELQINQEQKRGRQPKHVAAACITEQGREALRLLGEGGP